MKALLVIDVQDIYLKRYKNLYFIENVNGKIDAAQRNNQCIIYIQNVGHFKSNAFTNSELLSYLKDNHIDILR